MPQATEIRPRAARARRGVVSFRCSAPFTARNLSSVHHFSSTCPLCTCSSRTFSARTLPFVCRRHLSLLRVRNYFEGSVLERVLCRMQAFRATPPHPILARISYFSDGFWSLFPYRFRDRFFHGFFMILPPFFQRFFNEFRIDFTSLFQHFFDM